MATINDIKYLAWQIMMKEHLARMETARILASWGRENITGAMIDAAMPEHTAARQARWGLMEDATREFEALAKRGRSGRSQPKSGGDLRQQIADAVAYAESLRGPDLTEAFLSDDTKNRASQNPALWSVSIHESAHAIACCVLGIEVSKVTAYEAGGGVCSFVDDGKTPKERWAIVSAAGCEATHFFCLEPTTRMDYGTHKGLQGDGLHFDRELADHYGRPVAYLGPEALHALSRAAFIVKDRAAAISGLAKIIFDNVGREVPGESCREVFSYFNGDRDDELTEQRADVELSGERWPFSRGSALVR